MSWTADAVCTEVNEDHYVFVAEGMAIRSDDGADVPARVETTLPRAEDITFVVGDTAPMHGV